MKSNNLAHRLRIIVVLASAFLSLIATAQFNTHGIVGWGAMAINQSSFSQSPVVQVAANNGVDAAVRADGSIVVWGNNYNGQCSIPPGISGVAQLAVGQGHMIVLKSNGTVACWGLNTSGQCNVPAGLSNVVQVAAGENFSLALESNGTLVGWGDDNQGQLRFPAGKFLQIATQPESVVALLTNGQLAAWGYSESSNLIVPKLTEVTQITGYSAVMKNGTIAVWGYGEPGYPDITSVIQVAGGYALKSNGTIYDYGNLKQVPGLTNIVQIASAESNDLVALTIDGSIISINDPNFGASGPPINLSKVAKVSSGSADMVFLSSAGTVAGYGKDVNGELDLGALTDVSDAQTNGEFIYETAQNKYVYSTRTMLLKTNGTVEGVGTDNYYSETTVPTGLENVTQISVSPGHNAALLKNGAVVCWGKNLNGQCDVPKDLPEIKQVAAGENFTLALTTAGKVIGWGANDLGQLTIPTFAKAAIAISAGTDLADAILSDGSVVAWGSNTDGQSTVPTGLADLVQVSTGSNETVVRSSSGHVVAWGVLSFDYLATELPSNFLGASDISSGQGQAAGLTEIDITPSTPYGIPGESVDLDIFLRSPAPAGSTVTFTSNNAFAPGPPVLHLATSATTAAIAVPISPSATNGTATITATYEGVAFSATFLVLPKTAVADTMALRTTTMQGGYSTYCMVKLGAPLLAGGGEFTVTSSSPYAFASQSVYEIPAGTSSFSFPILSEQVAAETVAKFTITIGAKTIATANLTLIAPAVLSFTPAGVYGGQGTTLKLTFATPAPAGGLNLELASNSASVKVPASTIIAAGVTSYSVPLTTTGVNAATSVTVSMTQASGRNPAALLTLEPASVNTVAVTPTALSGQNTGTLSVDLLGLAGSSGSKVALTSSYPDAHVPSSITVPSGKSSASVGFVPDAVTANTTVTVRATIGAVSKETTFTLEPATNHLVSLKASPVSGIGGHPGSVVCTFNAPSGPSGLTVVFKSNPDLVNIQPSATSVPGATSLTVQFFTNGVDTATAVPIQASAGAATVSTDYTIEPAGLGQLVFNTPEGVQVSSFMAKGGATVSASPVPNGTPGPKGFTVALRSSSRIASVPPSVVVSQTSNPAFNIATTSVSSDTPVTITANYGTTTVSANLTLTASAVNPATLLAMQVSGATGGNQAFITLFAYGVSTNGFTVKLTSSNPTVVPVPAAVTVGKGSAVSYLTIQTTKVSTATTVTITATAGSVTLRQTMIVDP